MATATMGLRRRVHQVTSTSSTSASNGGKRGRSSENNNSPSQGNLNSLESPAKKSRTATLRSRTKELEMQQKKGPPHWSDPRPYASIAGLSLEAQAALCSENGGLPSPMSYIDRLTSSSSMATFVGNGAAGGSPISYLDISNMTTGPRSGWPAEAFGPFGTHPACTVTSAAHAAAAAAAAAVAVMASPSTSSSTTSTTSGSSNMTVQSHENQKQEQQPQVSMNFPNDAMFGVYQPWVIKTYGDLAKTKTITIKKYARILRTLRGEEVNSAENSKFRFWVKSKGFHVGQPEGYEAKPADRIIGRHAVTSPGLDPPLYVPTQPPHNKTLNGAENSSVPGRVYKKVAIVENFFDIIHAVHVDLEGRPGKHAGQKRTYRTITETYAFLPREAVTRFLLGCTECQRRPRTPSPSTTAAATPPPASPGTTKSTPTTENSDDKKSTEPSHDRKTPTGTVSSSPRSSPKPATAMSSTRTPSPAVPPKEACHPPESHHSPDRRPKDEPTNQATSCTSTITTSSSSCENKISNASRMKDERYNPLSITNLLRKDPIPRRPPLPLILHQPSIMGPPCMVPSTTHLVEADAPSAFHKVVRTTPPLPAQAPCIPVSSLHCSAEAVARTLHYAVSNALQPLCPPMTTLAPTTTLLQTKLTTSTTTTAVPMSAKIERPVKEVENIKVKDEVKEEVAKTDNDLKDRAEVEVIEVVEKKDDQTKEVVEEMTKNVKVEVKTEVEEQPQESFPPAAGLIDTNLNLLATIQQIHCQVMLALTQRLRSVPTLENLEQTATAMNTSTFTMDSVTKSTITGNPESS